MKRQNVQCPYCNKPAKAVKGKAIYPHRPDLYHLNFWMCAPCDAWVGCHKKNSSSRNSGYEPLGRLANAELRKAKQAAHAAFDPLWKFGEMPRGAAYGWLASELNISPSNCHIGMFDVDTCRAVVAAVEARQ